MCRRCTIYKGRAVGKSTELGAYELQVQGRTIAKVSSFKPCEPVKGPVHELEDLEEMKNAIAAGLQIPKEYLEPSLTWSASVLLEADKQLSEDAKRNRELLNRTLDKMKKP
jgi:hypothetical protein